MKNPDPRAGLIANLSPAFPAFCIMATLLGCNPVGPNYVRPALEAPRQWMEDRTEPSASPASVAIEEAAWWKELQDPVLDGLVDDAVRSNLDIRQAQARILQARASLEAAGAAAWPSATGSGSMARRQISENALSTGASSTSSNFSSVSPFNLYGMGFDASWELDVFGGIRRGVEAARARLDAGVEDFHGTVLTLLGDVAGNYVALRADQEQLAITHRNVAAQQESVDVTRARYKMGLTTYLDVSQAEAQKLNTQSEVPRLEASIKASIHGLSLLLGREPNALKSELSPVRPLPSVENLPATGLPSDLLTRRPDVRRAERQLAAASADIGVATADLYPRFDLTLGMGLQSLTRQKLLELSSGYWSVVPAVSMLLLDGGAARAKIDGKRAVYEEALAGYRSVFLKALEDVENALSAYYAEHERVAILEESVRASRDSLELAGERYRKGLSNFLDVLDAQRSLYIAQIALNQARQNLLTDVIALYKALGGGWKAAG